MGRAWWLAVALAGMLVGQIATPRVACADSVRVVWSPVAQAAGYRVYVRSGGEPYVSGLDTGSVQPDGDGLIRHIVDGLDLNRTLYFSVTTYDDMGREAWSNELRLSAALACAPVPRSDCYTPEPRKSKLALSNKEGVERDRSRWQWKQSAGIADFDLGDPMTVTNYTLCLYDEAGGIPQLVVSETAAAGEMCGDEPCWRQVGSRGYKYERGSRDTGVFRLMIKTRSGRRAKLQATATRQMLPLPEPVNGTLLAQDPSVIVQLVNDAEPPVCWEAVYAGPARSNTSEGFSDESE